MTFITEYNTYKFTRTTTTFAKDIGVSSVSDATRNMGGAFIILDARITDLTYDDACRLRLYSDAASRDADINRAQGNFNIGDSIALIAEVYVSAGEVLQFDPPIIGNTFSNGEVFYHLSGSTDDMSGGLTITSYTIGAPNNSQVDRQSLRFSGSAITTGNPEKGTLGTVSSPKSFLILSASATSESRLRLYSRPINEVPQSEISRSFTTSTNSGSLLIADMMFDSASFQYPMVPILEAYTWTSDYAIGNNQVGYILENRSAQTPTNITASLYIYNLEE